MGSHLLASALYPPKDLPKSGLYPPPRSPFFVPLSQSEILWDWIRTPIFVPLAIQKSTFCPFSYPYHSPKSSSYPYFRTPKSQNFRLRRAFSPLKSCFSCPKIPKFSPAARRFPLKNAFFVPPNPQNFRLRRAKSTFWAIFVPLAQNSWKIQFLYPYFRTPKVPIFVPLSRFPPNPKFVPLFLYP